MGTGNDAEIYFDSSNLYIKETTGAGDIYVESDDVYIRANGGGSTMAAFKSGAESILYHNGNAKATTDVGGIIITGVATATGFSGPLTGTATGLSGSPSIEVTNIVGAAASIAGIVTATGFSGTLTGTATGLSGSPSVELTNIVGAAASIAGIVTATTFIGALTGNASGSSGSCSGNSATATEATNVTVTANNSGNETVYPLFVDGATGTQGAETDTGLYYNPLSGALNSTSFVGSLTGTVVTVAQPNITSLGTLSSLNVSGKLTGGITHVTNIVGAAASIAGIVTATTFSGALTGNVTGNASGSSGSCSGNAATATVGTTITIADESSDKTFFPLLATAATGNLGAKSGTNLTFNSSTGDLAATSFNGGGNDIVTSRWTLGADGTSNYTFTGPGGLSGANDPTIYLARGQTYEFVNGMGAHPFEIRVSDGGSAYNTGVTNNGASSGTIKFEVPFAAPNTLVYQCTAHAGMLGNIVVYPSI